jgi:glucose-6-phosphate 1-epimerase
MSSVASSNLSLPDGVRVVEGQGGLPAVQVDVPACSGELYLQGAQLTSWRPLGTDALWVSRSAVFRPGTAIRGGVPICFPWFANGLDGTASPAHGFARVSQWQLVGATREGRSVELILALADSEQTRAQWPYSFAAGYRVRMSGDELALLLTVTNTGEQPFAFEEALHAYFGVADIESVTVDGLAGARYLDMVPGADRGPHIQDGPITFTGETDRTFQATGATATIHDGDRTVTVSRDGSNSAIVWNPWIGKAASMADFGDDEWTRMLCVETANVRADAVTLEPDADHTMIARISVRSAPVD